VFAPLPDCGGTVSITGEDARHLALSLRMRPGEAITVCDGQGREAACVAETLSPALVTARVLAIRESGAEPSASVTLCVALSKSDKMEWVLQKGTELGAAAFRPFLSERCVSRPADASRKQERWDRIVREAAMQSGRGKLPIVHPAVSFAKALAQAPGMPRYLCHEDAALRLTRALEVPLTGCVLFTGPEGGFTPAEAEQSEAAGVIPVSLGPRILRCETAPIAALAALLYHYNQL